jgi:hypothetical protein
MTGYLTKPIDNSLLLAMVKTYATSLPAGRNSPVGPGIGSTTDHGNYRSSDDEVK